MASYLITANSKVYNHNQSFQDFGYIDWSDYKRKNFKVGDTVYIYSSLPDARIRYQTEIIKTNIPFEESNYDHKYWKDYQMESRSSFMRLKLLRENTLFMQQGLDIMTVTTMNLQNQLEPIIMPFNLLMRVIQNLFNILKTEYAEPRDSNIKPIKVYKGTERPNKYSLISQRKTYRKTDYLLKAKEDHVTGLKGEKIAISLERERVQVLNLDPDIYLKYVAEISDVFGYDIESVDIRNGKQIKIYIEVKTTRDNKEVLRYFKSSLKMDKIIIKKRTAGMYIYQQITYHKEEIKWKVLIIRSLLAIAIILIIF